MIRARSSPSGAGSHNWPTDRRVSSASNACGRRSVAIPFAPFPSIRPSLSFRGREPFMYDAACLIQHPEIAAPPEMMRAATRSTAIIADRERGKLPAGLDGARASHPAANERYIGNEEPSIEELLTDPIAA